MSLWIPGDDNTPRFRGNEKPVKWIFVTIGVSPVPIVTGPHRNEHDARIEAAVIFHRKYDRQIDPITGFGRGAIWRPDKEDE